MLKCLKAGMLGMSLLLVVAGSLPAQRNAAAKARGQFGHGFYSGAVPVARNVGRYAVSPSFQDAYVEAGPVSAQDDSGYRSFSYQPSESPTAVEVGTPMVSQTVPVRRSVYSSHATANAHDVSPPSVRLHPGIRHY